MADWELVPTAEYLRDYSYYEKKRQNELIAVQNNLDSYFEALKETGNPLQVKAGYIHPEPNGIRAIDQKGGKQKVKLQQTRMYIYPDSANRLLYLLKIGDKTAQREDINFCRKYIKEIRKEEDKNEKI